MFDYKIIRVKGDTEAEETLEAWGNDGYDMLGWKTYHDVSGDNHIFIFRRYNAIVEKDSVREMLAKLDTIEVGGND